MKDPNRERKGEIKYNISLNEEQKEKIYGYIYKITSPSNKIYIGKTTNLKARYSAYKNNKTKSQNKIYNSILKYGWEKHTFEVLDVVYTEENSKTKLSDLEIYYIKFYNSFVNGLNLSSGGEGVGKGIIPHNKGIYGVYKVKEETKIKISSKNKGRKVTEEQKVNYSLSKLGDKNPMFNKKQSEETKLKKSKNHARCVKLINLENNEIYNSIKEASDKNNINPNNLRYSLFIKKQNNYNIVLYEGDK